MRRAGPRTRATIPEVGGPSAAALALLRVRQGRLGDARALLTSREEHPTALHALAELRLAEGEPLVAAGLLERAYRERARRRPPLVTPARPARRRLPGCDDVEDGRAVRSPAHRERRALRARDRASGARRSPELGSRGHATTRAQRTRFAREALDVFSRLGMPHEAAEARVEVARAIAAEQRALAIDEAKAAHDDVPRSRRIARAGRRRGLPARARRRVRGWCPGRPNAHRSRAAGPRPPGRRV